MLQPETFTATVNSDPRGDGYASIVYTFVGGPLDGQVMQTFPGQTQLGRFCDVVAKGDESGVECRYVPQGDRLVVASPV